MRYTWLVILCALWAPRRVFLPFPYAYIRKRQVSAQQRIVSVPVCGSRSIGSLRSLESAPWGRSARLRRMWCFPGASVYSCTRVPGKCDRRRDIEIRLDALFADVIEIVNTFHEILRRTFSFSCCIKDLFTICVLRFFHCTSVRMYSFRDLSISRRFASPQMQQKGQGGRGDATALGPLENQYT